MFLVGWIMIEPEIQFPEPMFDFYSLNPHNKTT